jgi:NAD(P)-dependent dehydrogenase (short-subunit alcohol dehydrogenase family)
MTTVHDLYANYELWRPIPRPYTHSKQHEDRLGRKQLRMDGEFKDKVALVTGAGAGIGRAIALRWTRHGGTAIVSDVAGDRAQGVAAEVSAFGGRALASTDDVTDPAAAARLVAKAVGQFGGLDVLFNVAGVNLHQNVEEMSDAEWYRIVDTNLTSVVRFSRSAIPEMRKRGGGAIVNVASIAGVMGENRCAAYTASKGGVVLLTRNMAMDFARHNIRVNALCPGSTLTPRIQTYLDRFPGREREMAELCPMKRFADPDEIAQPAIFLASSGASYMTGTALVVDGGMTAGFRIPHFDDM